MAALTLDQALSLAAAQHQAGQLAAAEATCRRILAQQPDHAAALHQLGLIATAADRHAEAAEVIARAIGQSPDHAAYHSDLGVALRHLGRLEEAVACFQRAIELRPDAPDFHYNLGHALEGLQRFDEAIASYGRALALRPGDDAEAHNAMGNVLAGSDRADEAIASYRRAIALDPDYAEAHYNLGITYSEIGQLENAGACCERAVILKPDYPEAHCNLGLIYFRQGLCERALTCYRRAIACRADFTAAHWNLAIVLLTLGHYEEGWRENEWRLSLPIERRRFSEPRWDGGAAPGRTIMVHAEQGHGDALHFLRYLPLVRERSGASRVMLDCPVHLVRLLAQTGGWNAEILARENWDGAVPPFDLHLPMLSLPLTLGLFAPPPMADPYLRADPGLRATWRERLGPAANLRVGIAWAGHPQHKNDRNRSIEFERLLPILRVRGVSFHSLQVEPRPGDSQRLADAGVIDLTAHIADFADTAALMAELDLIISVDTAAAHLAGALGRPVWTLVPFVPDWRWGLGREDTPWYPTMRLFRQRAPGDWDEVVARVAAELSTMTR